MRSASILAVLAVIVAGFFLLAPPVEAQNFVASLSAGQTVPRANSQASGSCTAVLLEVEDEEDPEEEILELSVYCVHNVANAVAAHIHRGAAGEAGPVALPFDDPDEPAGLFELSPEDFAYLVNESLYVNIHSADFPSGEIRGQLRFQSGQIVDGALQLPITGDQVVPPVTTDASGRCFVAVENLENLGEPGEDPELVVICYHDVENPTAAHVHLGAAGENGPVVIDLGDPQSPIIFDDEVPLAPDAIAGFLAGEVDLYVQVHSTEHPPGELRGQIEGCIEDARTLCLQDNRFRVEADWRDFMDNTGPAQAIRETPDAGLFWFFDPDNSEILVKVLDACNLTGFNTFWVFYAATTNVEFTLTVTDTRSGEVKEYSNELGMAAPPVTDTRAFATCP